MPRRDRLYVVPIERATNITDDGYVICPYCNKKFKQLGNHCIGTHGKSRKETYELYPTYRLCAPSINKAMSKGSDEWRSDPVNLEKLKRQTSEQMKEQWRSNSYFIEESVRASTSRIREYDKDPGFRRTSGYRLHVRHDYRASDGKVYRFRSTWERDVATFLDSRSISWCYEDRVIQIDDKHNYYPDFYLPQYNLILEIHPISLIDDLMLQKEKASVKAGYRFKFITECELKNLDNIDFNVT